MDEDVVPAVGRYEFATVDHYYSCGLVVLLHDTDVKRGGFECRQLGARGRLGRRHRGWDAANDGQRQ